MESVGDLIGSNISDKTRGKSMTTTQTESTTEKLLEIQKEIYIRPENRQNIIDELSLIQPYK